MRHRASRPFIDLWRRLPRAIAHALAAAAELSPVRAVAALMVGLSLATGAYVVVASVGGASPNGDASAALAGQDGRIGPGDGEPETLTSDTPTSGGLQSQATGAPDPTTTVSSGLPSTLDPRTGAPSTGTAAPSASPSPSVTTSTTPEDPTPEDHTPPHTSLSKEFPDSDSALFSFTASEPASFTCSLDGAAYTPCDSPTSYSDLDPGWHTFAVLATDAAGNVDPSRVEVRWRAGPAGSADH